MDGKNYQYNLVVKDIKNEHVLKVNTIYHCEVHHLLNILRLGNTIVHRSQSLLSECQLVDEVMRTQLEKLQRIGRSTHEMRLLSAATDEDTDDACPATQYCDLSSEVLKVYGSDEGLLNDDAGGKDTDDRVAHRCMCV